jgi:hypothetical protein
MFQFFFLLPQRLGVMLRPESGAFHLFGGRFSDLLHHLHGSPGKWEELKEVFQIQRSDGHFQDGLIE